MSQFVSPAMNLAIAIRTDKDTVKTITFDKGRLDVTRAAKQLGITPKALDKALRDNPRFGLRFFVDTTVVEDPGTDVDKNQGTDD